MQPAWLIFITVICKSQIIAITLKGEFKFCSINDNTATLSNSFKCNSPTDDVVPLKIEKSYIALVEDHYQVNLEAGNV